MNHQAQIHINNIISRKPSNYAIETHALSTIEATALLHCLNNDATSYIYSSIVIMADATLSINKGLFTWATVKLYYATFYAIRSLLAINGVCIFYIKTSPHKTTPFILDIQPGQLAKKGKGTTHKLVLDTFKGHNIEPYILSQPIDLQDPLEWLMQKREEANYKIAKFYEPQVPKHFKKIIEYSLRRVIKDYLSDTTDLYLFDPDHAILSYPLRVIQIAYKKLLVSKSLGLKSDEISYLCQLFSDTDGYPLPDIHKLFKNL